MSLPPNNETYGEKAYWDERYTKEDEFDWFADYHIFKHHVITNVNKADRILHLGLDWFDSFYVRVSTMTVISTLGHIFKYTLTNGHRFTALGLP